jgi:hypothetical protein
VAMIASFGLLSVAMRSCPWARRIRSGPVSVPWVHSWWVSRCWASSSAPCAWERLS